MSIYTNYTKKEQVDLSGYNFSFSLRNKCIRVIWKVFYIILFRPFDLQMFNGWRSFLLRLFGAKIGKNVNVYASAKIWAPWNLDMGDFSSLGPKVDCYNQGRIKIGKHTVVSQKTYLCASTHNFTKSNFPLVLRPLEIKGQVWIAADAFIGPGVTIGEGAVVGARSAVFNNVEEWTVVGGNPAKYLKVRIVEKKGYYGESGV